MLFSSAQLLFSSTLLLGTMLSISSSSWFGAWIGLELNLMSFIPLISSKNNQYSSEAALKYFLIQALGSSIIILSASLMLFSPSLSNTLFSLALLLKAGAAPFHFWFPSVMEGLQWPQAILLMTIQKIAPMSLLSYLNLNNITPILSSAIILSAIIGGVGGINQTFLRKIMAYSSINHMSWMLAAIMISETSWLLYFIMYSIISSSIGLLFNFQEAYHISHILNLNKTSPHLKMLMSLSLLSLGGLPPFTGFIPKWLIIQEMVSTNLFFILTILLMSALLTLFYYLRIILSILMLSSSKTKWSNKTTQPSILTSLMLYLNFCGLFIPSFFILLI
uniref:NADH-ubiquinone oxidoreductase chain 2 n=1 Tax=Solenocera crassicornis TaxID=228863 RepID=A0A172W6L2_9EUCA|nr:NADH dehydrogenase subunit 2 [Solenocera crassicornis]YP_010580180.1 NADH dehydrogenase subunit 2 [Solenocera melantho]ANF05071.1 NADH dehydrogenase subunit 2 [Solenocera crassicornis]AXJ93135.1 NADH dehydrogenase subunit 2 [Solenocera crassicornis]UZS90564.1 NADH dehydrogenase subunit 2 [Solenocera melantho]